MNPYFNAYDFPGEFNSITDAEDFFTNCGVYSWEWFENFKEEELVRYLYLNADGKTHYCKLVYDFLLSKNEDPSLYSLNPNNPEWVYTICDDEEE